MATSDPSVRPADQRVLRVEPRYPDPPPPILHVNFARVSQLNGEVLLDLGNLDDQKLIATLASLPEGEPVGEVEIEGFVRFRFGMTLQAFAQLKAKVDEIWDKMKQQGLVQRHGIEP